MSAGTWRNRAALTVREVAEILSVSQSHVRRNFKLVRVLGLPRVRVDDVRRELGEIDAAETVTAPLRVHRKADRIVGQILARRR